MHNLILNDDANDDRQRADPGGPTGHAEIPIPKGEQDFRDLGEVARIQIPTRACGFPPYPEPNSQSLRRRE